VYRDDGGALSVAGSTVFAADDLGTYTPNFSALTATDQAGLILYDSKNYLRTMTHGGVGGGFGAISGASRAAGKRAAIHMTTGILLVELSSWALSREMRLGLRIGVFEQDPGSGLISVEPGYSMFVNTGDTAVNSWANAQRRNRWERRVYRGFSSSNEGGLITIPVMARGAVRLDDNECWALYLEVEDGSQNMNITPWLRTLVSDEG